MKKVIELTIPVLVALTWGVLAITTLQDVGELAAAVAGPSPDQFGPAMQIGPNEPLSSNQVKLHVVGAPEHG